MTIEKTKEAIKVMQAYTEGRSIEVKTKYSEIWSLIEKSEEPSWDFEHCNYRIKPKPHYRPFKNAEEVMEAIKEHGDWVRFQNGGYYKITFFNKDTIRISDTGFDTYTKAFTDYKFIDGTSFGKLEE